MGIAECGVRNEAAPQLATLLDYLQSDALFLLCDPERTDEQAEAYAEQIPANDPFSISWEEFREQAAKKVMTSLEVSSLDPEPEFSDNEVELLESSATSAQSSIV